jgi:hypothetical protein
VGDGPVETERGTAEAVPLSALFCSSMRAAKCQYPNNQAISSTFLDLGHAQEEDFRLPPPLFVILDCFRIGCMSNN